MRARVLACVRTRARARVRAPVRACVRARAHAPVPWGIRALRYEIADITVNHHTREAMEKQSNAERLRRDHLERRARAARRGRQGAVADERRGDAERKSEDRDALHDDCARGASPVSRGDRGAGDGTGERGKLAGCSSANGTIQVI